MVAAVVTLTLIAIFGLATAVVGYAFNRVRAPMRVVLLILSLAVFFTRMDGIELPIQLVATALIIGLLVINFKTSKQPQELQAS